MQKKAKSFVNKKKNIKRIKFDDLKKVQPYINRIYGCTFWTKLI